MAENAEKVLSVEDLERVSSDTFAMAISCILQSCPSCGNPVPLNGPLTTTQCPSCLSDVEVPSDLWLPLTYVSWNEALSWLSSPPPAPISQELKSSESQIKAQVEKTFHSEAFCIHCREPLGVAPDAWQQPTLDGPCSKCGERNIFLERPSFLSESSIRVTHVASTEGEPGGSGLPAEVKSEASKPVLMSCPSCSGGLTITAESQRTTQCEYCGSSIYLPDELWRQLHPTKKAVSWEVIHQVTPEALRDAAISEKKGAGCVFWLIWFVGMMLILTVLLPGIGLLFFDQARDAHIAGGILTSIGSLVLLVVLALSIRTLLKPLPRVRKLREIADRFEQGRRA